MRKTIVLLALCAAFAAENALACTSAIITGRATADGRPLMWKHRDTDEPNNRVEHFRGAKYGFIGLVNSPGKGGVVWAGTNSAGFSIMNTASYNLKEDNVKRKKMGREGEVMYKALAVCGDLADFEKFLDKLPRPMGVQTNFGVIDAKGGAAYYEVDNTRWTKFDVNDPENAPDGYYIRTNYSFSGREDDGAGYIRYENARKIFAERPAGGVTPEWIFDSLSRSFYHSLLEIDLRAGLNEASHSGWFIAQDFIPRRTTTASIVFQGVKPDEDPSLTVMWTVLGYPPVGVAVPLFEKSGDDLPVFMTLTAESENSEMCDLALAWKAKVFSIKRGSGEHYFNAALLFNDGGTGYMQRLAPVEKALFEEFNGSMEAWRSRGVDPEELAEFYSGVHTTVRKAYKE